MTSYSRNHSFLPSRRKPEPILQPHEKRIEKSRLSPGWQGGGEDMPLPAWDTRQINGATLVAAPDGSDVRILCAVAGGSSTLFTLAPGAIARAVIHRTVDEMWHVVAGRGRLWRRHGGCEEITELTAGVTLTIPVGTEFQFRNDGGTPLDIFGVTMPPWPGAGEAVHLAGTWVPTV
jgi:mannose-6-phosphate isomerase-like protein (cupin superfamily)